MNTRILKLRKSLNLTQLEFAKEIGLKQSSYSDIENGNAPITERTIIAICSKFNVNEEWLKTGKGNMFNIIDKKYNDFFQIYNSLNPVLQDFLISVAKNLLDAQTKL